MAVRLAEEKALPMSAALVHVSVGSLNFQPLATAAIRGAAATTASQSSFCHQAGRGVGDVESVGMEFKRDNLTRREVVFAHSFVIRASVIRHF